MAVLLAIGIVLGFIAAFAGRWAAEGMAGTYDLRAVVSVSDSETTEGQNGPHTTHEILAVAENGRAIELPTGETFGLAEPVIARISSLTDRVLSVRGADAVVEAHHPGEKIAAMSIGGVLVILGGVVAFVAVRPVTTAKSLSFLAGFAFAAYVVLAPLGFGGTAYRESADPVPNLWEYRREAWGQPPVIGRGQTAVSGDSAVRVLDSLPEPPEGAEAWLSGFHVLALRIEAARLGDTALELSADEHGAPKRVKDCAGAPGAFDGTAGLVCFVVPQGYQPKYFVIGTLDRETLLTLQ
ncbi:hypothetical protein BS329_17555 [Amycolatopsis coloradensis]|uniref:Uncharacterized protein n=1 Tax=Amycolatopsis coloradensis TaxID=76021 RepID=A0A1R0KSX7_9PSEU|nr:hypothetical protein [Amycolatopsis coloradensis]OLZ51053.1 hypothetical protein BS329_17555 [Amycolatopsis coloradensis]